MDRFSQELELYTIPSYSSWFSWHNIHEVERFSLREFFDGSSITRSPRIYKDYRDFIISKFRENPSKKLTFTDVRKSLVGDISILLKVFTFLEKWGLINFNVADGNKDEEKNSNCEGIVRTASFRGIVEEEEDESWKGRVKVEEGPPHGVRVVAAPNSMKPIVVPPMPQSVAVDGGGVVGEMGEGGFKWPPLASYSDVYGELRMQEKKGLVCGSCKEDCDSAYYEYTKEGNFILCEKCFNNGNYEKDKLASDDFKLKSCDNQTAVWTEAETLLLLESVLKHGDDWDLVATNVQTKSKLDCISKLIQLPFGDHMLGSIQKKSRHLDTPSDINNSKPAAELASSEPQEPAKAEDSNHDLKDNDNGDDEKESPPKKRTCTRSTSDVSSSLMKQVSRISTMLGPQVTASAAEAAVTALCYENQCSREIFDDDDDSSDETSDQKRTAEVDDSIEKAKPNQSEMEETYALKNIIPLNLRARAATATALGAAAANAKLLADQEEREMGQLVATMIEAQVKKLRRKMKYFEDLEVIMRKEHAQLEELEESLVAERLNVLQRMFNAGIDKSKDHILVKSQTDAAVQ
ncbi:hypothetical protein RD792_008823 [Penstemon davidsonii]|uniref:SWI/SNF complex subunit SWI3A n=1 Tax=Penstemon davidsonii TaxID=160366 RepID=A0ABR0DAB6_9LAMI|nr:hypothetical protein RD792_008823 [Penstemon davidsonii]